MNLDMSYFECIINRISWTLGLAVPIIFVAIVWILFLKGPQKPRKERESKVLQSGSSAISYERHAFFDYGIMVSSISLFFLILEFFSGFKGELCTLISLWTDINGVAFFVVAFLYGYFFFLCEKEISFFSFFQQDDILNYYGVKGLYWFVMRLYFFNCVFYLVCRVIAGISSSFFLIFCSIIGIILTIESACISLVVISRLIMIDRSPHKKYNVLGVLYRIFDIKGFDARIDKRRIETNEHAFEFLLNEYVDAFKRAGISGYSVVRPAEEPNKNWMNKGMVSFFLYYLFFVGCGELLIITAGGKIVEYMYLVEVTLIPSLFLLLNFHSCSAVQNRIIRYFLGEYGFVYQKRGKQHTIHYSSIIKSHSDALFMNLIHAANSLLGYYFLLLSNNSDERDDEIVKGISKKVDSSIVELNGQNQELFLLPFFMVSFLEYHILGKERNYIFDQYIVCNKYLAHNTILHDYIIMLMRNMEELKITEKAYSEFINIIRGIHKTQVPLENVGLI